MSDISDALRRASEFWARSAYGSAHHIPNDQAVHALLARDDFRTEARMNARPRVLPGIGAEIGAYAPNDEFLRMRGSLEDISIVPVQTAL